MLNILSVKDDLSAIKVTQTTPAAPTLLTATDLLVGDTVRVVWSGTGPFYNVYYRPTLAGPYVKANGFPLPGSPTQYDVGGLTVGVSYTFKIHGVNGAGTEGPASNELAATPTFDQTISKFATPTWSVKINGITNPNAILTSVELGFGSDVSNAVFTVHGDPEGGGFPVFNDVVEVIVNGRLVLKGKIKGISSRVSISGLTKTFTAISNISQFMEKVVPPEKSHFNSQRNFQSLNLNKLRAPAIISQILGSIPSGTPDEFPGEVHVTDQTTLDAVDTVIRKLGNYKLYFNITSESLEVYRFGQGGNNTRQFIKGVNIIDYNIVENQQGVVDKVTVIGPPRNIRRRDLVPTSSLAEVRDSSGISRGSFVVNAKNVRELQVTGRAVYPPSYQEDVNLEVLPGDMGIIATPPDKFPKWPVVSGSISPYGADGDFSFRHTIKNIGFGIIRDVDVDAAPEYIDPDSVRMFISELPEVHNVSTRGAFVDNKEVGIVGGFGSKTRVEVQTGHTVGRASVFVTYTHDGDSPQVSVGSGTIERSITDSQYQILIDAVPGQTFNNETEILALMQKRAQAEYDVLHRPKISGTITVIGDENIDLRSTVSFGSQLLDVIKVIHNFTNGFTTQVALTNEPFIAAIATVSIELVRRRPERAERVASTAFRIDFQDLEIDKKFISQRKEAFLNLLKTAGTAGAVYGD